MDIITCPHCQTRVVPTEMGRCPSCRAMLSAAPASSSPLLNPYRSPRATESRRADSGTSQPFVHQAAKFSLYAPLCVILLGCFAGSMAAQDEASTARALWMVNLIVLLLGVVFGLVGIVGGWRRNMKSTLFMGIFGFLLNGAMLALIAWLIIAAVQAIRRERLERDVERIELRRDE